MLGDTDIASSSKNVGTKNIIKGRDGWYFLNREWDGDPISDYGNIDLYSEGELLRRYTDVMFVDLKSTLIEGNKEAAKYWKEGKKEAVLSTIIKQTAIGIMEEEILPSL